MLSNVMITENLSDITDTYLCQVIQGSHTFYTQTKANIYIFTTIFNEDRSLAHPSLDNKSPWRSKIVFSTKFSQSVFDISIATGGFICSLYFGIHI